MKTTIISHCALLILVVIALSASASSSYASTTSLASASTATPSAKTTSLNFDLPSAFGSKVTLNVPGFTESGCILARIESWLPSGTSKLSAAQLAITINGSDRTGYYARVDGNFSDLVPLWTSYAVSSIQVKSKTPKISWQVSVYNFSKSGTAKGTLYLEYPFTQVPCEFKIAASPTKGQVDLSWRYTSKSFTGVFLVERTTDGKTWNTVAACKKPPTTSSNYSCKDTKLTSATTYYYRACAVTSQSSTKCGKKDVTPALSVKVP